MITAFIGDLPPTAYVTGDRTGTITVTTTATFGGSGVTTLVNGVTGSSSTFISSVTAGQQIRFDFGSGNSVLIDEAKLYMENSGQAEGNWKWRGSNDLMSFTDLTGNIAVVASTVTTHTGLNGNTTGYRYYCFEYVGSNAAGSPGWAEFEFKQVYL